MGHLQNDGTDDFKGVNHLASSRLIVELFQGTMDINETKNDAGEDIVREVADRETRCVLVALELGVSCEDSESTHGKDRQSPKDFVAR